MTTRDLASSIIHLKIKLCLLMFYRYMEYFLSVAWVLAFKVTIVSHICNLSYIFCLTTFYNRNYYCPPSNSQTDTVISFCQQCVNSIMFFIVIGNAVSPWHLLLENPRGFNIIRVFHRTCGSPAGLNWLYMSHYNFKSSFQVWRLSGVKVLMVNVTR